MNVFIDTNVFLSFYHFTRDELNELEKLEEFLKDGRITLFTPEQVTEEFWRNREIKISDALKKFSEQNLGANFPQIYKDYASDYEVMRKAVSSYERANAAILDKIKRDTAECDLQADKLIERLFSLARRTETVTVFDNAQRRFEVGNPPRKSNNADCMGDAVNWESLLADVPDSEDLHLITGDKDFMSPLDKTRLNSFLLREWHQRKGSKIHHYPELSAFLRKNAPSIQLATESKKNRLIEQLGESGSFLTTHDLISKLSNYSEFTSAQLDGILDAVLSNNQVRWVAADADVYAFLNQAIRGNEKAIDPIKLYQVRKVMEGSDGLLAYADEDDFALCGSCEPGDDQMPGVIDWSPGILNNRDTFTMGRCSRCNGVTVRDRLCKATTPVTESEYDEALECEGGCGRRFMIVSQSEDSDGEEVVEVARGEDDTHS